MPRAPRNAIVMDSNQAGIIDVSGKHLGSSFDDSLKSEGVFEEA
jgi:hypothetical protein